MIAHKEMIRLIKIDGKIWELSILWEPHGWDKTDEMSLDSQNYNAILGRDIKPRGLGRVLSNNTVVSKARAIVEISINGLPSQNIYAIYHSSKGFYCNIQKRRVYLKDLISDDLLNDNRKDS